MLQFLKKGFALSVVCSLWLIPLSSTPLHASIATRVQENAAACTMRWRRVDAPNVGPLRKVAATAANDVWAMAAYGKLHWNGSVWQEAAHLTDAEGMDAYAPDQTVIVGVDRNGGNNWQGAAWRWDGTGWDRMKGSHLGIAPAELLGVAILSGTRMYAVGVQNADGGGATNAPLIAQWVEKRWVQETAPAAASPATLWQVAAVSANDVWAAGYTGTAPRQLWVIHRDAQGWSVVPTPAPGNPNANMFPHAIVALAHNDVWIFGEQDPDRSAMALHWDGISWQFVDTGLGANFPLLGADAAAANDIWVVGENRTGGSEPLLVHWDGATWTQATARYQKQDITDAFLEDVVSVGNNVWWAVGARHNGVRALVLRGGCGGKDEG